MIQEVWDNCISLFNFCAVYYVIQLVRCVLISFLVFAVVFFLRKTLLKHTVFLKGAIWGLFLPVLFVGKMRFFYENSVGIVVFSWWTGIFINHIWICRLYFCIMFIYIIRLFYKRRKLKKLVACMEKRKVEDTFVYVTKMPVTPSTVGVFQPKNIIKKNYRQFFFMKKHIFSQGICCFTFCGIYYGYCYG